MKISVNKTIFFINKIFIGKKKKLLNKYSLKK